MTIILGPATDDLAIKDWLDLELLEAKMSGRLPRSTDRSQLVVMIFRGQFKPTRPAPGSDETPAPPPPAKPVQRKTK